MLSYIVMQHAHQDLLDVTLVCDDDTYEFTSIDSPKRTFGCLMCIVRLSLDKSCSIQTHINQPCDLEVGQIMSPKITRIMSKI